jgi:hypothetical protein
VTFFLFDNFEIIRSFSSNCLKYETPACSSRPGEPEVYYLAEEKYTQYQVITPHFILSIS